MPSARVIDWIGRVFAALTVLFLCGGIYLYNSRPGGYTVSAPDSKCLSDPTLVAGDPVVIMHRSTGTIVESTHNGYFRVKYMGSDGIQREGIFPPRSLHRINVNQQ